MAYLFNKCNYRVAESKTKTSAKNFCWLISFALIQLKKNQNCNWHQILLFWMVINSFSSEFKIQWKISIDIFWNEFSSAFFRFITFYEMKVDGWTWILCSIKQVHLLKKKKKTRSLIATTTTTILLFTCSRFTCFSLRCLNRESHSRPHSISMRVLFLSIFISSN